MATTVINTVKQVTEFYYLGKGDAFLNTGGELRIKIEPIPRSMNDPVNVIDPVGGAFYHYSRDQKVIPVDLEIKVS